MIVRNLLTSERSQALLSDHLLAVNLLFMLAQSPQLDCRGSCVGCMVTLRSLCVVCALDHRHAFNNSFGDACQFVKQCLRILHKSIGKVLCPCESCSKHSHRIHVLMHVQESLIMDQTKCGPGNDSHSSRDVHS